MSLGALQRLTLALAAAAVMVAAPAAIYKWTDTDGVVHYTDTPPPRTPASEVPLEPAPGHVTQPPQHGAAEQPTVVTGQARPSSTLSALGPPPDNAATRYLQTVWAGFHIRARERDAAYDVTLQARTGLPFGAVLEVRFENPADQAAPFVTTVRRQGAADRIRLTSPRFSDLRCANYAVEVRIYRTSMKKRLLGTHRQLVQSRVNLSKVGSAADLVRSLARGNCP